MAQALGNLEVARAEQEARYREERRELKADMEVARCPAESGARRLLTEQGGPTSGSRPARVLCVMQPDRFVPILTYSGEGTGKRDITRAVFGMQMPKQDQISMQIGRLVFWSNDLLNELLGEGFESRQHASAFLWWAKDGS